MAREALFYFSSTPGTCDGLDETRDTEEVR